MLYVTRVGHPLRWYLPETVYEVTTRTMQERFLLRPGGAERELILGVLGRGLAIYARVMLHAFVYLSNHMHMLLSSKDATQLAPFIGYVNGQVGRLIGPRHGWSGTFWSSRARVIPVLDDDSAEGRLRYILSHGVKEGLVACAEDWPGASSTPALLGERLRGRWTTRARLRHDDDTLGEPPRDGQYEVPITPLPAWARLPAHERVERARALCASIAAEHRARRDTPVLGVSKVLAMDPLARPDAPARRRAPLCHASTPVLHAAFRQARAVFLDAYRAAAHALEEDRVLYRGGFPAGSFGGARKLVSGTSCLAPWLAIAATMRIDAESEIAATRSDARVAKSPEPTDESITMTQAALSATPPRSRRSRRQTRSPAASDAGGDAAPSPQLPPKPPPTNDRGQVSSA